MIMARKNRNLASFGDVANNNINQNKNTNGIKNINVNNNDNVNIDVNKVDKNNNNINAKEHTNMNTNTNAYINDSENVNANNDTQINKNNNINKNLNENMDAGDYLDKLIEGTAKKAESDTTTLTGIYLRNDLLRVLDRLAKKGGRGAKSRIVNEAIERIFKEKGLI